MKVGVCKAEQPGLLQPAVPSSALFLQALEVPAAGTLCTRWPVMASSHSWCHQEVPPLSLRHGGSRFPKWGDWRKTHRCAVSIQPPVGPVLHGKSHVLRGYTGCWGGVWGAGAYLSGHCCLGSGSLPEVMLQASWFSKQLKQLVRGSSSCFLDPVIKV